MSVCDRALLCCSPASVKPLELIWHRRGDHRILNNWKVACWQQPVQTDRWTKILEWEVVLWSVSLTEVMRLLLNSSAELKKSECHCKKQKQKTADWKRNQQEKRRLSNDTTKYPQTKHWADKELSHSAIPVGLAAEQICNSRPSLLHYAGSCGSTRQLLVLHLMTWVTFFHRWHVLT